MFRIQTDQPEKIIDFLTFFTLGKDNILNLEGFAQTPENRIARIHGGIWILKNHLHLSPLLLQLFSWHFQYIVAIENNAATIRFN